MTFTDKQRRAVLGAIAELEPRGISVELLAEDRANIREQIAELLAPVLGIEAEAAFVIVEAKRMTA